MRYLSRTAVAVLLFVFLPATALAGPASDAIVIVADSRKFDGVRGWWANLYNESHLLTALITVALVPLLGLLLGKLTTLVLTRLGINLTSRQLAEH